MANRVLTWNCLSSNGNKYHIGATYYMEADYIPVAVRIVAEIAPNIEDAEFEIYDDGVSIFVDRAPKYRHTRTGMIESDGAITTVVLAKDESNEINEDDFTEDLVIEEGSFVSCNCVKDGGGRNFTVHLELESLEQ